VTGSKRTIVAGLAAAVAMLLIVNAHRTFADTAALKLKASLIGAVGPTSPMTIELFRWSTDVERAPVIAALNAPPPTPAPTPPSGAPAVAAGRAGRAAGRGGRAASPPPSPLERLTNAIKAAPTVGFIWSDGPTGYSIKYAWRSAPASSRGEGAPNALERVVLVTDRRLGANSTAWPAAQGAAAEAGFTVVEMRIDGKGVGEAKSSLTSPVVVDAAANTLAIDKYSDAPVLLKVTR
jgi:hypothetical protein